MAARRAPLRAGLLVLLMLPMLGGAAAAQEGTEQEAPAPGGAGPVVQLSVEGPITPATDLYFEEALTFAEREDASAILLVMNTPGGGLDETFRITDRIQGSRIPVIGYVSPATGHAWSAGTIILLSTHVAGMAPFSVIGSSQPVSLSEGGFTPINDSKIVNALVAKVESLAAAHGRNVTAAREFVTENLNLNAEEALRADVIEVVAESREALLQQAHGMAVNTTLGPRELDVAGRTIVAFEPSLRVSVLDVFLNPLIAGLLMLVGIYALIFGLGAPGHGAEVLGGVAIVLGLLGLGFSVSVVAIVLIVVGALLLLVEVNTPGFGVFGGAGIVALILGTIFLAPLDPTAPGKWSFPAVYQQQVLLILALPSVMFAGFVAFALYKVMEVRKRKPAIGGIVGDEAEVMEPVGPGKRGFVWFHGERWQATSTQDIAPGERVIITHKEGPVLSVEPRAEPRGARAHAENAAREQASSTEGPARDEPPGP